MKKAVHFGVSLLLLSVFGPLSAKADSEAKEKTPAPALIPHAEDRVGGHLRVGASGATILPFGKLSSDQTHREVATGGWGTQIDLAYGLNRHVALGVAGEYFALGAPSGCTDCTGSLVGGALFFRYHVAQGLRFDPWISYGLGFQSLTSSAPTDPAYTSLEWLRVQVGADWFANRNFGLGPVAEFGASSVLSAPDNIDSGASHFRFVLGLRLLADF